MIFDQERKNYLLNHHVCRPITMRIRSLRIASQIFFLILSAAGFLGIGMTGLVYPYFFCVACPGAVANCPIGALQHSVLGIDTGAWLKLGLYTLGFVALVSVVAGRAFCGWACPMGALQDLISPVSNKLSKRFGIPRNWNARYVKYGMLIFVIIAAWIFRTKWFCLFDPGGMITATIPMLGESFITGERWVAGDYLVMKIIYTVVFFAGVFLVTRAWCRFLCPYGAMVAPFNRISLLHIKQYDEKCIHCGVCTRKCPMKIDAEHEQRSNECILCGRCVEACPVSCLDLKAGGKTLTAGAGKK